MVQIKETVFKDYGKCVSISNGVIEAIVTVEVGPRIIFFGYVGGQNILCAEQNELGYKSDKAFTDFFGENKKWKSFGGHRIWISPEAYPDTYYPDGDPVSYRVTENGAVFTPPAETENGVAKTLELRMDADDGNMQVVMTAENISDRAKDFAIWGITVSEKDGTLIIPMSTRDTGLLPNRIVSVWPYTDMGNDRISWTDRYAIVRQDRTAEKPMKLGFDLESGTVYYVRNDDIFCKKYDANHPDGVYPDGGCSFETYTNSVMIEIETLSELKTVQPGEKLQHMESWSMFKKPCEVDFKDEKSIDRMLQLL